MTQHDSPSNSLTVGLQEVLKTHLVEYQKVFETILQLREHQYRLTNYGLIAIGALFGGAGALYGKAGDLPEIFWMIVFGAFLLFSILSWYQIYVDRKMLGLADYLLNHLEPAVREALGKLVNQTSASAEKVLRYEEYSFGMNNQWEKAAMPGGRAVDFFYAGARYAIPMFGAIATLLLLAVKVILGDSGLAELAKFWTGDLGKWGLGIGLLILSLTIVAYLPMLADLRRLGQRHE